MGKNSKQYSEYGSLPTTTDDLANAGRESTIRSPGFVRGMTWVKRIIAASVAAWLVYYFIIVIPFTAPQSTKIPALQRVKVLDYEVYAPSHESKSKLIVVGDVHGHLAQLKDVLAKSHFKPQHNDTLVLLGDFISKGPKSVETLNYLMKLRHKYGDSSVECVRGNHEHNILSMYAKRHNLPAPSIHGPDFPATNGTLNSTEIMSSHEEVPDNHDIVRYLEPAHIEFLSSCPAILSLPNIKITHGKKKSKPEGDNLVMVHGGLQWDIPTLEEQDPLTVMNVRTLLPPHYHKASPFNVFSEEIHESFDIESGEAMPWMTMWAKQQRTLKEKERQLVYYGHNAANGLDLRKFTRGLDSGCAKGGRLTSAVITQRSDLTFEESFISVKC